jgi:hypothetical protein
MADPRTLLFKRGTTQERAFLWLCGLSFPRKLVFLAALLFGFSGHASANTVVCGQTISSPGYYTLLDSCTCYWSGICINIIANDVTLNLNNKTVACRPVYPPPSTNATTFGVMASSIRNVRIFGADPSVPVSTGKITGCFFGLQAAYSENLFVDRVDFSGNTYIGANTGYSINVLLTRNVINGISGYVGDDGRNGYAVAFNGCGTNCTLSGNTIKNIVVQKDAIKPANGEGVGVILSSNSTGAAMRQNWFDNADESGKNIAIWVADGSSAIIEDNTFTGWWQGVSGVGTITVTNNRFLLRDYIHPNSLAIYGISGCATNNLVARYALPVPQSIKNCGGNDVYQ